MLSNKNPIETWNEKVKDAVNVKAVKQIGKFRAAYRNEEDKVKYENITFTSVLEAVVNSSFKIPSLTVEVNSFDESGNVLGLFKNAYRNKVLLEQFLKGDRFKNEVIKCVVDSKGGFWGLMEIIRDKESKLGYVIKNRSQFDLVTDPEGTCHDLTDNRWIALQWVKHKDILKKDKTLKHIENLQGNYNPRLGDPDYIKRKLTEPLGRNRRNINTDLVRGWTIYDRDKKEKLKIVDGQPKEIFKETWDVNLPMFPFPIIPLWYYFNPDRQLPISPASNIGIIENEVNDLRHFQLNHARKVGRTIWTGRKGALDTKVKRIIEESSRDILAEVKKGNPIDALIPVKEKQVSFEYNSAIAGAKSGLSSLGHGFLDARNFETAAEPNILASNSQRIAAYEAGRVEDFVSKILTAFLHLIQKNVKSFIIPLNRGTYITTLKLNKSILEQDFLTKEDAQLFVQGSVSLEDITNKDSDGQFVVEGEKLSVAMPFLSIKRDLIRGDFMVFVDRGSMGLADIQLTTGLYNMFKGDRFINQISLRKIVLDSMENSEVGSLLRTEQDVLAEAEAQQKKAVEGSLVEPKLKTQTDLQKTQMKTTSNEKIADGKLLAEFIKDVDSGGKGGK